MPRPDLLEQLRRALIPIVSDVAEDPRKLKPGQLLRLINGTPLGAILTEPQLRRHRQEGGSRIGDGKTIDLIRYAAWLGDRRRRQQTEIQPTISPETRRQPEAAGAAAYDRKRESERARNAAAAKTGRDIYPLPEVADPERRRRCLADPEKFYREYFPQRFPLPFSASHRRLIAELERVIEEGGLKAFALPRGSGKTTLCEAAVIRAVISGKRKYVAMVGASRDAALESLDSIKAEFETNPILAADFPEVCYPIEKLEGINNRQKGQLYQGERTHIKWSGATLVLPTIAGSLASSAMLCVRGITGRIRGMKFARPCDGENARPDLCIIDDPQTDASANSDSQCEKRLKIIQGAILGLAGPGKKIAAAMPCTIIRPNDLADRLLNRDLHPEWSGDVVGLLPKMPTNLPLWDEYAEVRRAEIRAEGDGSKANAFYRKHRKSLEAGAEVMWEERKLPGELSALQHAMNLLIDKPAVFDAEYQNAPKRADTSAIIAPPDVIRRKLSGLPRGMAPAATTRITTYIDVQHSLLYWLTVAWSQGLGGSVIDYATWPEQSQSYFTLRQARNKLPGATPAAAVVAGLTQLMGKLRERRWQREDGAELQTDMHFVDCSDGTLLDALIAHLKRLAGDGHRVMPAFGRGLGPHDRPMADWPKKEGQQVGDHWCLQTNLRYRVRQVVIDTNFWKSFVHQGLAAPLGLPQAICLFGDRNTDHTMLIDHFAAEYCERMTSERTGRTTDVFKAKPGKPDNHLFDCLTGAAAAASALGGVRADLPSTATKKKPPPPSTENRATYFS